LRGKPKLFFDLLMDNPGEWIDADQIKAYFAQHGPEGSDVERRSVASSLTWIGRRCRDHDWPRPYDFWPGANGAASSYEMKPTVARLFREVRRRIDPNYAESVRGTDWSGAEGKAIAATPRVPSGSRRSKDEVQKLVRKLGRGQGTGLSARERSLVERRAMEVVAEAFVNEGWTVQDVSSGSPYDLLCRRRGEKPRRVEVKGTTGKARTVILTRNEVAAAREDPEAAVLAIVQQIALNARRTKAVGGVLKIISSWQPDDDTLIPIVYRYQVPLP
jgi:hypothetical protein